MKVFEKLDSHLQSRLAGLTKLKEKQKIIGYAAGGYFPEELALACNAIPICFIQTGNNDILRNAGAYVCRWFDPFWRSQIGYLTSGQDPYYNIADLIVVPITDNHVRAFSNTLGFNTPEKESFVFGVPHVKDKLAIDYYHKGIIRLKDKLEKFTGETVTDKKLKQSIELCNRERELFREISLMRKSGNSSISSRDFIKLNHASFLADKKFMIAILENYLQEKKASNSAAANGPTILFTGSTLAEGDSKVMDIIEECGGRIIIEEFAEGIRPYWGTVKSEGDLMANLADTYFMDRVCPGWFRPGTERLDFLINLAKDYKTDGLIWYQLMFRESYKVESFFFPDMLKKETGIPMFVVESEYDAMETGPMKTRIQTFFETMLR